MIPYEELCAALERYAQHHRASEPAQVHTDETALPPPPADQPTGEHLMPHAPLGAGDDEHTNVGVSPIYDDRSNELDIGDVLSDEDAAHKNN
jgi:hypothetical protein